MIILYFFFFFFLLLSQVQETNPTTGSLEIISVTEDEPPVPQIQFTFKRFFFIPQARVDPSADGSGKDNPQPLCAKLAHPEQAVALGREQLDLPPPGVRFVSSVM